MGLGELKWAMSATHYFNEYGNFGSEIKVSRSVAFEICEQAFSKNFWILAIDCGQLVDGSKYLENSDEGWCSKFALMSVSQRDSYDENLVSKFDLYNNNESAYLALTQIEEKYTVFIPRIKLVTLAS